MELYESGEMYLETILRLSKQLPVVRSVDVSEELGYSKPSVSRAMKLLNEQGYLITDKSKFITLTPKGLDTATKVYNRHKVLSQALQKIGVSSEIADADACRIEHVISDETYYHLKQFISND